MNGVRATTVQRQLGDHVIGFSLRHRVAQRPPFTNGAIHVFTELPDSRIRRSA
jgi:hypothetical protein